MDSQTCGKLTIGFSCILAFINILTCVISIVSIFMINNYITLPQSPIRQNDTRLGQMLVEMYDTKSAILYRQALPEDEDRKQDDPPDLQFLNLLKPVAHFSGLDFDEGTQGKGGNLSVTRNWANPDGSDRKLLYNGMSFENGSITVPAAGVYHITSHVKFYVEDNKKDDKPLQTFQHQVVRYSASSQTQVVLFENAVTECKEGINDGAHLEYPSGAGGLAQLDAGDQVMVKSSHLHLLRHDRDWHVLTS